MGDWVREVERAAKGVGDLIATVPTGLASADKAHLLSLLAAGMDVIRDAGRLARDVEAAHRAAHPPIRPEDVRDEVVHFLVRFVNSPHPASGGQQRLAQLILDRIAAGVGLPSPGGA